MRGTRPRLTIVTPDFPPAHGGIQTMLGELAMRLVRHWDVVVIAPSARGAPAHDADAPYAIKRTRTAWGGLRSAAALAEMTALAREARSDVVVAGHVLTLPPAIAAARYGALGAFLYGSELWAPKAQHVLRMFARRPRRYVAISRFTASAAGKVGVPEERIEVVEPAATTSPCPDDCGEYLAHLGLTNRDGAVVPFFLTVARLVEPHKGQDVVIRALPPVVAHYPAVRYVIAGDGPLRPSLEQLTRTSGVKRSVVFTGGVDEPTKAALLANCLALAMPSREARAAAQFEGFGIAYLEAALCGRPSIGGNAGAVPEVVVNGETGLLVDPQDTVSVLGAMTRLLDDPRLADELGEQARRRAATFTWERTADGVNQVLRTLT